MATISLNITLNVNVTKSHNRINELSVTFCIYIAYCFAVVIYIFSIASYNYKCLELETSDISFVIIWTGRYSSTAL